MEDENGAGRGWRKFGRISNEWKDVDESLFFRFNFNHWLIQTMPFSEELKKVIRNRAAFRCCMCQTFPVEIHHIVPQAEGGSDEEQNAAPLCPNCHTIHGGNPETQKKIREMRDHWYKVASVKYPIDGPSLVTLNEAMISGIASSLKEELRKYVYSLIESAQAYSLPKLTGILVDGIQLERNGQIPIEDLIAEGPCACERIACVGHNHRVYCYFTKKQHPWVIQKRLYWQCYDEIIVCTRCGQRHPRGHVGREDICLRPYIFQNLQSDTD